MGGAETKMEMRCVGVRWCILKLGGTGKRWVSLLQTSWWEWRQGGDAKKKQLALVWRWSGVFALGGKLELCE